VRAYDHGGDVRGHCSVIEGAGAARRDHPIGDSNVGRKVVAVRVLAVDHAHLPNCGFWVKGLGFKVYGVGLRVKGLGFRVEGLRIRT
jgi:hypothetical protein